MVKSYKGVQVVKTKERPDAPLKVSDHMTKNLITFSPDQSIYDVVETLLKYKISGGPVMNDKGELVGVISEGDCLKEVVKGKYLNHPNLSGKVSEHMSKNVISIDANTNIFEASDMFLEKRIRRFPVVKNGKLVGQISQKDIMKAVLKLKTERWEK